MQLSKCKDNVKPYTVGEQMSLRGDVYVFGPMRSTCDTVSLHDVLSLSGKNMPEETLHLSPVDCQKSVMSE